ncbi:response regulator [soil metagenome]
MSKPLKKKILLAEDDASMRRFIEIILKQADFEVSAAEDGLAAMSLAFKEDFDAVVTDAIMPNLSGYDLCRMIRANYTEKKIPCVILSGLANENPADSNENLADAFLLKDPSLKENLLATLKNLL